MRTLLLIASFAPVSLLAIDPALDIAGVPAGRIFTLTISCLVACGIGRRMIIAILESRRQNLK